MRPTLKASSYMDFSKPGPRIRWTSMAAPIIFPVKESVTSSPSVFSVANIRPKKWDYAPLHLLLDEKA